MIFLVKQIQSTKFNVQPTKYLSLLTVVLHFIMSACFLLVTAPSSDHFTLPTLCSKTKILKGSFKIKRNKEKIVKNYIK